MRRPAFVPCIGLMLIAAIVFVMAVPPATAASGGMDDNIAKTKTRLAAERAREQKALSTLNKTQSELNGIQNRLNGIKKQLATAMADSAYVKGQIDHTGNDLLRLEEMLHSRRDILARRCAALWRYGPVCYLEIIISANSFRDLIDRYELSSYFIRHDMRLMDEYRRTRVSIREKQKELNKLQEELDERTEAINALWSRAEQERQLAAYMVQKTQEQYRIIQSNRVLLEKALDEMERQSQELGSEIRNSSSSVASLGTGTMIWPVRGWLSSLFGWRTHPVLKTKRFHGGLDIAVPSGTPVLAADSGVVKISGMKGDFGYLVAIAHNRHLSTFYGHNGRLLVKAGDVAVKGQTIAYSDNTGLSSGPHCHFEVRMDGERVNPLHYLPP